MKIKLKVKHLITIIVSMVLLVPLFIFIINPQLNFYLAKKGLDKGNVAAKTKVLEGLETDRLGDFQKWETIQRYMLEGLGKGNYDILIGPTFTQYSQDSDMPFTLDEKLPYIKKYIEEGPVDRYLLTATRQLVSYYLANGNIEKADEVMFRAIERAKKSYMYEEFQMEQAQMKINQKKFAEAADLLEQFSERNLNNDYFGVQIAQKQAELLLREGKLKEAYNKVQQTLRQYEEKVERGDSNISSANSYVYEHLTNMEKGLQKVVSSGEKALRTIHGKLVRSDGTPLQNVGVFLQDANAVNLGVREFEPYYHITNKNGEFRFDGVIPGSYQIILALAFDQIDGWTWPVNMDDWIDVTENTDITYNITLEKLIDIQSPVNQEEITDKSIHFSWDKVEGAAYYELSLGIDVDGGSMSSVFQSHITDHEITIPVEKLYGQRFGVVFSGDEETIDPKSLLAFANPDNRFSWSVQAYRKNGELITKSDGYRLNENTIGNLPFFYLKQRELTKADRLLLDKKLDKALAAYKESVRQDLNDMHSLRMIPRLLGFNEIEDSFRWNEEALPYLQTLAEKTNNTQDLYELIDYYYEQQEWEAFHSWFDRYKKAVRGNLNEYEWSIYGAALMKQGKLTEARDIFEEVMERDNSHRFVGAWLAVQLYLSDSYKRPLEIAEKYPERKVGESFSDWLSLVTNLKEESTGQTAYHEHLQDVLDLFFESKEQELENWLKTTNYRAMKQFILALQKVD